MRVLAVSSYPVEAAATRFRVAQFVGPLRERGIEVDVVPFLDGDGFRVLYSGGSAGTKAAKLLSGAARRVGLAARVRGYDLLFVQREAMPVGPGFFEWLYAKLGRLPMVLDLDDATYVRYVSPTYGRLGSALKFFGKTDKLIDRAEVVVCGNRFIAEHVEQRSTKAVVIPTIVDTDVFRPAERGGEIPVVGWIGTHSTFPFLEKLFPVLSRLAERHRFRLKIVGSGRDRVEVEGVEVENLPWSLDREVEDFRSLDIGLYPIDTSGKLDAAWLAGKSGFKAIQYMAVGCPFVVTPVGVCAEIGIEGETHLAATSDDEWFAALNDLLKSSSVRADMGNSGRDFAVRHFNLPDMTERLADTLRGVVPQDPDR